MPSPKQGIATAMAEYDSSSGEEDSISSKTSPELAPIAESFPGTDDNVPTASAHIDASVQEISPTNSIDPLEAQVVIHARAYQVEMFEESLKQNIIVAVRQVCLLTAISLADPYLIDGYRKRQNPGVGHLGSTSQYHLASINPSTLSFPTF